MKIQEWTEMKQYLPFLTIVLLIAGTFLCINFRTLKMVWFMDSRTRSADSRFFMDLDTAYDLKKLKLSPAERTFAEGYFRGRDLAWHKTMYETHPEDKIFLAAYIDALSREPEGKESELHLLLDKFRKLDPENAFPDFEEFLLVSEKAVEAKWVSDDGQTQKKVYTIRDCALLEKAVLLFDRGLRKSFYDSCSSGLSDRLIRLLRLKDDPFGYLQRNVIAWGMSQCYLIRLKEMVYRLLFYAETLHKEGKEAECRAILHSGPRLLRLLLKQDQGYLIEILVFYGLNRLYLEYAEKVGDREAAALYRQGEDFIQQYRKQKPEDRNITQHGGIWSNMMIPGAAMRNSIPVWELTPERMINYLVIDELALAGFCVGVLLLWCLHAAIALCKRGEPVTFSLKSRLRIIGFGMLLPLAVFLLYTHVDFLSGREFYLRMNLDRLLLGIGLLLFSWIPLSGIIRNETRGKPFASYARSMLLPLALLLFLTGAVLRPLLDYEIINYWKGDTLFRFTCTFDNEFRHSEYATAAENRAHDYLSAKLKMFMQGHSDAFSLGKEAGK